MTANNMLDSDSHENYTEIDCDKHIRRNSMKRMIVFCAMMFLVVGAQFAVAQQDDVPTFRPAGSETAANTPDPDAMVYKGCYLRCKEKVGLEVIPRSEGLACMDLCISDVLGTVSNMIEGRLYLKLLDGRVIKGLKVPLYILSLDKEVKEKPEGFDEQKKQLEELLKSSAQRKRHFTCTSPPSDYDKCGFKLEKTMGALLMGMLNTSIDDGSFSISGLGKGNYIIWVDWFQPQGTDVKSGELYRWLIPISISDQKQYTLELTEDNLTFVLDNFNIDFFSE